VIKGYVIGVDRSKTPVDLPVNDLQVLQRMVGGYLEAQYDAERTVIFFINEDGKSMGLSTNELATAYWWLVNPAFVNRDVLVGDVVVVGAADRKGDITSITPEMERLIVETYLAEDE
jgi:uncharacterized protein DUF3846